MPSPAPITPEHCAAQLQALGAQIRAQRKALRLSATVTAEAAGLSRVTLHRIEKGEPSVTMGAWCNALAALALWQEFHAARAALLALTSTCTGSG